MHLGQKSDHCSTKIFGGGESRGLSKLLRGNDKNEVSLFQKSILTERSHPGLKRNVLIIN